ncbi:MAG TPA: ABC transporter ATP-binding protein [Acidimicrobiales bacterium]|nr:ABC transporter ATP-binding protein [Acidimicrobiales bacterium]
MAGTAGATRWTIPEPVLPIDDSGARASIRRRGDRAVHGYDLAQAVGRAGAIDPDDARRTVGGVFPAKAPVITDPEATEDVDVTYEIRVEGGPAFGLRFAGATGVVQPVGTSSPHCGLEGDPVAIVLWVYGRVPTEELFTSGRLRASGPDPSLGPRFKGSSRTRSGRGLLHPRDRPEWRGMGVAITLRGLSHTYRTAEGPLTVLGGLDLDLPDGGYAAVTGPSGAGKTTLLSLLGGLEQPQRGRIDVGGQDLTQLGGDGLAAYRRATVGFVFQHFGLLETLTAAQNVELAGTLAGATPAQRRRRALELLDAVGLSERADHRPSRLSGGERQRVAIARSLVNEPKLLLADEPTGNLDDDAAAMVVQLLEDARRRHGCTLVLVTHNRELAARAEQRVALERGRPVTVAV